MEKRLFMGVMAMHRPFGHDLAFVYKGMHALN